jgi:curved DNA-binding protein CbpA
MTTYYDQLDISPTADQDEIESAWRELVKEVHPDQNNDPNAEQKFVKLKEAYEVLSDPKERARYDRLGHDQYLNQPKQTAGFDHAKQSQQHQGTSQSASSADGDDGQTSDQQAGRNSSSEERTSQKEEAEYGWRAYTRGHEAADHVWNDNSTNNTADRWPPRGRQSSFIKKFLAFGLVILPQVYLTSILFPGISGITGIQPDAPYSNSLIVLVAGLALIVSLIATVTAAEYILNINDGLYARISDVVSSENSTPNAQQ